VRDEADERPLSPRSGAGVAQAYDWGGCYIGGHLGAACGPFGLVQPQGAASRIIASRGFNA